MVSPIRMPPAVAMPLQRPPRTMLRIVTRVSGPGSSTINTAATVNAARASSMAILYGARDVRRPGHLPPRGRWRVSARAGRPDRDAALTRPRRQLGGNPAVGPDALDHAGQI